MASSPSQPGRYATHIAEALTLPPGGTTQWVESSDGTRIHALIYGPADGPTVVLAHAVALQGRALAYQVRDLCASHRVVVYDARGHGLSAQPAKYTIEALGHDLQAVLQGCVPASERAVIAGHSMGSISLMSWARLYPTEVARRVAAAVLINATAHAQVSATEQHMLRWLVRKQLRFPLRVALGDGLEPVHMDALMEMLAAAPPPVLDELTPLLARVDLRDALPHLTIPTWVVAGGKDRASPPEQSAQIAHALPNLKDYVVLPRCGHMAPWEERAYVSQVIAAAAAA